MKYYEYNIKSDKRLRNSRLITIVLRFIGRENYMYKHHERKGERIASSSEIDDENRWGGEGEGEGRERGDVTFISLYLIWISYEFDAW